MKKLIFVLAFASFTAHGAESPGVKACVGVKPNNARLSCFDAAMKADADKPVTTVSVIPETTIPLDIKGMELGMDKSSIRAKFEPNDCTGNCYRFGNLRKARLDLDSFAGSPVTYFGASFNDDILTKVSMTMHANSATLVFDALSEKYGKPLRQEREFKTNGGLSTTQVISTWKNGDAELKAESPSGKINEMRITLTSKSQQIKDAEKLKEKAGADL